jgi:hypothetical protein
MAKASIAGQSSLGVTFSYGTESTAGTKPASFTLLDRINSIGGITITPQNIDASALEDYVTRNVAGRADSGEQVEVVVNFTDETATEWGNLITAYKALTGGKQMWFQTVHPKLDKAFFFIGQPPEQIPQPEVGQNELLTVSFPLTIVEYKGYDTKVTVADNPAISGGGL